MKETILLVDDEQGIRTVMGLSLRDAGYNVITVASGEEALQLFAERPIPIVITDIRMPGMNGLDLLKHIKILAPETEVILISGHADLEMAIQGLKLEASDFITKPIDDGTIPNAWGSINIDDEGTPSRRNVLIENGVLKSYMIDKFNGRRMGMESTGNSRRQSYAFTPTSRMTNTYIAPGNDSDEDIISSIEYGLYAAKMGGGSVNPVTGQFNFAVSEGYVIRNGKICEPVRGASLIGKGSDIIMNIDMVGRNLLHGQGMCGSSSGSIPTNVGQPLIRVSSITVGGR